MKNRKFKRLIFLLLILCSFCLGCQQNTYVKGKQGDHVVDFETNDIVMSRIMNNARATFSTFYVRFKNPKNDESNFMIKYPFLQDTSSEFEYMWLNEITEENGELYGLLSNEPIYTTKVKLGDKVHILKDSVADWMYNKGAKYIGGESVKLSIQKVPEKDRTDWEKELLTLLE